MKNLKKSFCSLLIGFLMLLAFPVLANAEAKANNYLVPDADTKYYTESDISSMSLQIVCYAKNEIYARHGRMFNSKELTEYFSEQTWYNGTIKPNEFDDAVFNRYENYNVSLLSEREHALNSSGYPVDQKGYTFDDVYAYLGVGNADPIYTGLSYNKKSRKLKTNIFSFTLPASWDGEVGYKKNGNDSMSLYCKAVKEEKTDYDGILCTIMRDKVFYDEDEFPAYDYLGNDGSFYYYILYPTDIRFDPDRTRSAAVYRYMAEDTDTIAPTFEVLN